MEYYLEQDGKIVATAKFAVSPAWKLADKEILRGYDGALYFKGKEPKEALEKTKTKALAIVRELRKEKEYAGYVSQGIQWDTDEKSERRLNSAVTVMKDNPNVPAIPNFKPSDKVSITLTLPMAIKAGEDIMLYFGECFAWEDNIAEQINKCATVEQVKDIVNSL